MSNSNSLNSIGDYAFSRCFELTTITLPSSLTSIGYRAFYECNYLTSIEVDDDNQTYLSVDGILYDKSKASLICCPAKKSGDIVMPNFVTSIEDDAFRYCSEITSIAMSGSLTSIGSYAFCYCHELTSITLPISLKSIGSEVFYRCYNINAVTSLAVVPPECGSRTFESIDMQNCTLYVPGESIEAYKEAPEWSKFYHVEDMAGIDSVAAGSVNGATEVFNLTGAKVADSTESLPAGIYIVREGSAVHKVAIK